MENKSELVHHNVICVQVTALLKFCHLQLSKAYKKAVQECFSKSLSLNGSKDVCGIKTILITTS